MENKLNNINIVGKEELTSPASLIKEFPADENTKKIVRNARGVISSILSKNSSKTLLIVGPCSIHNFDQAIEYAQKLKELQKKVANTFFLVMRVYFEKPRTTVGWKGFINDPELNGSFDLQNGIRKARKMLLKINQMGLPVGTEALDPIMPQFLDDLIAWYAIGARTAESQTHREMASGLSAPVGIKNGTDGSLNVALNGMLSISEPHSFLGINKNGKCCIYRTSGNSHGHIVLRGGKTTNYDAKSIANAVKLLTENNLPSSILVDCSHGNSNKDHTKQPEVFRNCINQIQLGNKSIIGLMLESNLEAGKQSFKIGNNPAELKHGVSITDACIDFRTTEKIILEASKRLA